MKSFLLRIYIVSLILRLIPIFLTRDLGIGLDDMFQYDMLARSLASGHGFRWYAEEDLKLLEPYVDFDLSTATGYDPQYGLYTSFRAPLYPAFLAIVYFFSGLDFSRFFFARLAQAILLGAPLAPLTYLVSRALFPDSEKTAKTSAWMVAAYPMLLVYPLGLGTENPFFVLLLAAFLFILLAVEKNTPVNFAFAGIFLGLTTLTRSVILPFAGLVILYLLYLHKKKAFLMLVAFVLTVAPWSIRNSLLHQKLTGVETSMGYNLYLGYHPQGNGSFIFGPSLDLLTIMDDAERDAVGTQKALAFIEAQPERFVPLAINRLGFFFGLEKRVLLYFYSNNIFGFIPAPLLLTISAVLLLPFTFLSTSAALAFPFLKWKSATLLLLLLFIAYLIPHVLILAEDRFHLALVPYFAILAAYFWHYGRIHFRAVWGESMYGKFAILLSVLCVLLLLTNWGMELVRDADKIAVLLGPNGNSARYPY